MYRTDSARIEWIQKKRRRRRRQKIMKMCRTVLVVTAVISFWLGGTAVLCREPAKAPKETDSVAAFAPELLKEKNEVYTKKVECIFQNPELPTGCEATAGTMLLRAYGYEAEKTRTADLIEKGERIEGKDGRIYGPHPDEAFIGDPSGTDGFGVFPGALAKAMQKIIDSQGGDHVVRAMQGLDERSILTYIDRGIPLCIWTSMHDREIEQKTGWYLIKDGEYTDEFFCWPSNEHCVVLTGYDEETVTVCDPLEGERTYKRESFFRHYGQVGSYALLLSE